MNDRGGLDILACGAGMISTTLALQSVENVLYGRIWRNVPVYDHILFCDLGDCEPDWVKVQVRFIADACKSVGIPFHIIKSDLYHDFTENFGERWATMIPFYTLDEYGHRGKLPRRCTFDYKIKVMRRFVRRNILGYKPGERIRPHDIGAHYMHIGYCIEEEHRRKDSRDKMFEHKYPLVEMKYSRADCFAYNLNTWGLETKASACNHCPFHKNFFFDYTSKHHKPNYEQALYMDETLEQKQKFTDIRSKIYITRDCKRIHKLHETDCCDLQFFEYDDGIKTYAIWNGF